MSRRVLLSAISVSALVAALACSRGGSPSQGPSRPADRQVAASPQPFGHESELKPTFDEKEMVRPVNEFREYPIQDYRTLPNCLDVFEECVKVSHEGRTEEQYRTAVLKVAQKPCRVVLEVVDVPAAYDFADFKILTDDGKPGLPVLERGGDLANYSRHLKPTFAINDVKAKGLDKSRSIADRVVLVGLGYVVSASPWGAGSPRYGLPKGDSRQVMLRAFGKLSRHRSEYEFAFMVRNWYIASQ